MKISKEAVRDTLYKAYEIAKKQEMISCSCSELIDFVMDNTHLTYKYILFTALAAKATDDSINPLCLQAKSKLPGAYDARSICHDVIVKFEMTKLGKALGGSNEPFLNKPARFPELSKNNAVRRGRDQAILYMLCDKLPEISSSKEAFDGLVYAIQKLLIVKANKEKLTEFSISSLTEDAAKLYRFIDELLNENYEGEILTLVVAGLYELFLQHEDDYVVEVHPVNQSGASSKEISDLDIYKQGTLYVANELKDKPFTDTDMRHAADKVIAAGKSQMNFIVGRHGHAPEDLIHKCVKEYLKNNFIINVIPVDLFLRTLISLIEDINIEHYVKYLLRTAIETKFKEETISYIQKVSAEHFNIVYSEEV